MDIVRRLAGSVWVRAVVSVGLLALVATQIDFGALRHRLSGGSWGWFALSVLALFASFVVGGVRWQIFLEAAGVQAGRRKAVDAYLIGTFTQNFLPTQLGGDVTRALVVAGPGYRIRSATTIVVDRATALACMIIVGWVVIAFDPGALPGQLWAAFASTTVAFVLACTILLVLVRLRVLRRFVPRRAHGMAGEIRASLAACLTAPVLIRTILVGLVFQGLVYLSAWFIARAISLPAQFAVIAAVLAPVIVISMAPVSIGGLGVREGSYVLLLGYAGVSATDATLFSLLGAASFAIASLPGALVLLRLAPESTRAAQPEDRKQERGEEDLDSDHEAGRREQGDLPLAE